MAGDQIRYDLLVQEALRGVVRKVLADAAREGLPGDHYFHIEFQTAAPGVRLSERMRERFPDRMTIILQHTFWNLTVGEEAMEVGLSFGGVEERVRVPFLAITGFFDESVQFGLRFEVEDAPRRRDAPAGEAPGKAAKIAGRQTKDEASTPDAEPAAAPARALRARPSLRDASDADRPGKDASGKDASGKDASGKEASGKEASGKGARGKSGPDKNAPDKNAPDKGAPGKEPAPAAPASDGAKVLSIDAFRKKN